MGRKLNSKTNKLYIYPQENFLKFNSSEVNKARFAAGLPKLEKPKVRYCLRCDQPFKSIGAQNRMCYDCANVAGLNYNISDEEQDLE